MRPEYGPEGYDKIAIIGSAPSSINLGPYADPSYAIWSCSPGCFGPVPRSNVWFEMHNFKPSNPGRNGKPGTVPHISAEYTAFLEQHKGPVMMAEKLDRIPTSERYPFEEMRERFGDYHWKSSIAWMLALAIAQKPKVIAIYGVDMAANEEYAYQRPSCQHFIGLAIAAGIEVILPPESDLMQPGMMYGVGELDPQYIKMKVRKEELMARKANCDQQIAALNQESIFLQGALDNSEYIMQTWCGNAIADPAKAESFASGVYPPAVPGRSA